MEVALKVCSSTLKNGNDATAMISEEARCQMRVAHPNIVKVYGHFAYRNSYIIVMQPAKVTNPFLPPPPLGPSGACRGAVPLPPAPDRAREAGHAGQGGLLSWQSATFYTGKNQLFQNQSFQTIS